jgi:hypothetical protein
MLIKTLATNRAPRMYSVRSARGALAPTSAQPLSEPVG